MLLCLFSVLSGIVDCLLLLCLSLSLSLFSGSLLSCLFCLFALLLLFSLTLSLFLGLFLIEVERRKTGSSALAALLGRLLILVEVQRAGRLVKARGDDGDADLVVERLVERRAEDRARGTLPARPRRGRCPSSP